MKRLVYCRKYKEDLPGMASPPYPGSKGQKIYESVSKKAWEEWLKHQTMLINEGKINLIDKLSRDWLNEQMELFLANDDYIIPSGFRAVEKE